MSKSRSEKRRENRKKWRSVSGGERKRSRFYLNNGSHAASCCNTQHDAAWAYFFWHVALLCYVPPILNPFDLFLTSVLPIRELTNIDMQIKKDFVFLKNRRKNRENSSGQKIESFILCLILLVPNKEEATVITQFLQLGFSRVSACKTRQPEISRVWPKKGSITSKGSQNTARSKFLEVLEGLTKFDQSLPKLTKFD